MEPTNIKIKQEINYSDTEDDIDSIENSLLAETFNQKFSEAINSQDKTIKIKEEMPGDDEELLASDIISAEEVSEQVINPVFKLLSVSFDENQSGPSDSCNLIEKLGIESNLINNMQSNLDSTGVDRSRVTKKVGLDLLNKANRLKKYRCKICKTIKIGQLSIKKHMNTHFTKTLWSCLICFKSFQTKSYLKKHMQLHEFKPFKCSRCSRRFKTKSNLNTHEKIHDGPKLQCEICYKFFLTKARYNFHVKAHNGVRDNFQCKFCPKSFLSLSSLNDHLKRHSEYRPYACSFFNCNKSFYSNSDLRKHTRIHILDRNVPCTQCSRKFYSDKQLAIHMKTHSDNKRFHCEICLKQFDYASQYNQHMRQHTGERPFPCPKCDSRFLTSSHLYRHIRTHKEGQNLDLTCDQCGKEFKRMAFLEKHKAVQHAPIKIKCEFCSEKFNTDSLLNTHIKRMHSDHQCEKCDRTFKTRNAFNYHLRNFHSDKPLKCAKCDDRFYNKTELEAHMLNKHSSDLQFFCIYEDCNRAFKSQELLDKHINNHVAPIEKNFFCDLCPKSFRYNFDYQQHLARHLGIKPYKCDHCDMTFNRKPQQIVHMQEEHPNAELYSCEFCEDKFVLQSQMTNHIKQKHKHLTIDPRHCNICNKNFSTPDKLRRHIRTHTDERPNICEFCQTAFKSKYEMMRHVKKRHTNERPFKCTQCEKAFVTNSDLQVHVKTHSERNLKCEICEKMFFTKNVLNKHIKTHDKSKPFNCQLCDKAFKYRWLLTRHLETHNETLIKE